MQTLWREAYREAQIKEGELKKDIRGGPKMAEE